MKITPENVSRLPLCGIYALSYILQKDVQEIFDQYKRLHAKKANWRGRTHEKHVLDFLRGYGHKIEKIDYINRQTLKSFIDDYEFVIKGKIIFVWTGGHFQTLHHGKIIDQTGHHAPENFKRIKKRVKAAYIITIRE